MLGRNEFFILPDFKREIKRTFDDIRGRPAKAVVPILLDSSALNLYYHCQISTVLRLVGRRNQGCHDAIIVVSRGGMPAADNLRLLGIVFAH